MNYQSDHCSDFFRGNPSPLPSDGFAKFGEQETENLKPPGDQAINLTGSLPGGIS